MAAMRLPFPLPASGSIPVVRIILHSRSVSDVRYQRLLLSLDLLSSVNRYPVSRFRVATRSILAAVLGPLLGIHPQRLEQVLFCRHLSDKADKADDSGGRRAGEL